MASLFQQPVGLGSREAEHEVRKLNHILDKKQIFLTIPGASKRECSSVLLPGVLSGEFKAVSPTSSAAGSRDLSGTSTD